MSIEKYNIGGVLQETEAFEAFADIPQNRVLLVEKLTTNSTVKPEVIHGLTSIEQTFEHFKPMIELFLETEEGAQCKESFGFNNLSDFSIKGITTQSNLLNELAMKKDLYLKIIRQLKTNKLLKQALLDKESKENLMISLQALINELQESNS